MLVSTVQWRESAIWYVNFLLGPPFHAPIHPSSIYEYSVKLSQHYLPCGWVSSTALHICFNTITKIIQHFLTIHTLPWISSIRLNSKFLSSPKFPSFSVNLNLESIIFINSISFLSTFSPFCLNCKQVIFLDHIYLAFIQIRFFFLFCHYFLYVFISFYFV